MPSGATCGASGCSTTFDHVMFGAGLTPEELEEQRRKEEVERLQKMAEEKAEAEKRDAEEAGLRRNQQEEWVGTTPRGGDGDCSQGRSGWVLLPGEEGVGTTPRGGGGGCCS